MGPEWDWYWVLIINIYIWLIPNINPIQATKYGFIMINGIYYMDLYCWLVVWKMNFYDFPYIGDSNPNWLSYFSEGLKPPTRLGKYPQIWVSIYHLMTVYHSLQPILTTWIQPLLQCGASQWCHKSYFFAIPKSVVYDIVLPTFMDYVIVVVPIQHGASQWCECCFITPMNTIVITTINHGYLS